MTTPALPPSDEFEESTAQAHAPGGASVFFALTITVLLAGSILGLLVYRAFQSPGPEHVLVVRGTRAWDGVELVVEGSMLAEPSVTRVQKLGNYVVPFFLPAGKYTLRVKSEDVEVYRTEFDLTREQIFEVDLARTGATTLPSTLPTTVPDDQASPGISDVPG